MAQQQPHFALKLVTPAAAEPLTLDQVKGHLRVTVPDDDDYISDLIEVARECVEDWTGRALLPTTYRLTLDRFPLLPNSQYSPGNPSVTLPVVNNAWPLDSSAWAILLPRAPVIAVTSIDYTAGDLTMHTMDPGGYVVDADSEPARVSPLAGAYWPAAIWQPSSVRVTFTAGYADARSVPAKLKQAIRLLVGHYYENREAAAPMKLEEVPFSVQSLVALGGVQFVW